MPPAPDKDAKIPCTSTQHLQTELDALGSVLELGEKEETWEKMERALIRFAGITRGGGYKHLPLYTDGIGRSGLGLAITACIISDRGRLSGVGTDLLQTLAPRLGKDFAPLVQIYLPALVTLHCKPNKVYLKRAEKCLSTIIAHCPLPTILLELRRGLANDANTCRRGCSVGFLRALEEWDEDVFGPRGVQAIEDALRKVGTDRDPEVRATGKKIYARFCEIWPERVDEFADPLTPTIRRYLGVGAKAAGAAPAKPARRPAPISKPPPPAHQPQANPAAEAAVSRHRVQALGGPATRPFPTAAASSLASAPARRSPQKPAATAAPTALAGPSRMPVTDEHHADPLAVRTRVRSGRYPDTLTVSAAATGLAAAPVAQVGTHAAARAERPNIFAEDHAQPNGQPNAANGAARYGRSVSHTVLPTKSLISPEQPQPVGHTGLGQAFRPVIAQSFSTASLPSLPAHSKTDGSTDHHEPVRRFAAPATRLIVRPASREDPFNSHVPTTPGHILRGAVRPQPSRPEVIAPIGGRLKLGQAQRRVISAPMPAQPPPPVVDFTPVPMPALRSAPAQAHPEGDIPEDESIARVGNTIRTIRGEESDAIPETAVERDQAIGEQGASQPESGHEPMTAAGEGAPLIDLSSGSSRQAAPVESSGTEKSQLVEEAAAEEAAATKEADTVEGSHSASAQVDTHPAPLSESIMRFDPLSGPDEPVSVPAAIPLPDSPAHVRVAPTSRAVSGTAPASVAANDTSAAPPNKVIRKPGLPVAARRPAAASSGTSSAKPSQIAPTLPPVRTAKPRLPAPEGRPRFKPTSHARVNSTSEPTAGGLSRSASASTVLSAGNGNVGSASGIATRATNTAGVASSSMAPPPVRAGAGAAARGASASGGASTIQAAARIPSKASKPPVPIAARHPAPAAPAARLAKPPVPKAVLPVGYARSTASTITAARGPNSLTAPTAASARRAADRVVSGTSAVSATGRSTVAAGGAPTASVKATLPPVKRERAKLKAPMPSFQPKRGGNLPGSGPAAVKSAPAASAAPAPAVSVPQPKAGPGIVAKVRNMPPPSLTASSQSTASDTAPRAIEVSLPASPSAKPAEVPVPTSPLLEYKGVVRVRKSSLGDNEVEAQMAGAGDALVETMEGKADEVPVHKEQAETVHEEQDVFGSGDRAEVTHDDSDETREAHQAGEVKDGGEEEGRSDGAERKPFVHDKDDVASESAHDRSASPATEVSRPSSRIDARSHEHDNDSSEEEEEEEIEWRPASPPRGVSASSSEAEVLAVEEDDAEDLIEFSASSRAGIAAEDDAPSTDDRRSSPSDKSTATDDTHASSPRTVLSEKDRNYDRSQTDSATAVTAKTPVKTAVVSEVMDKMQHLALREQEGQVDVVADVSIEFDD